MAFNALGRFTGIVDAHMTIGSHWITIKCYETIQQNRITQGFDSVAKLVPVSKSDKSMKRCETTFWKPCNVQNEISSFLAVPQHKAPPKLRCLRDLES